PRVRSTATSVAPRRGCDDCRPPRRAAPSSSPATSRPRRLDPRGDLQMTEYTDKTGAPVQVERSTTDEMFEIREPGGEVAGHADFRERDGERIFHHSEVGE